MQLPDGTTLMHGSAPYDPVKAHEYYIKNRKLKGRKPGEEDLAKDKKPKSSGSFTVKSNGKTYKLSSQQLTEQKAYAAQRVMGIKKKLHKLNVELKKKMAEAKKTETETKKTAKEAKKPDSAAEKSSKAKDSEKYRDKNKQTLKNKSKKAASEEKTESGEKSDKKSGTDSVESLKKTIEGAQKNLKDALNRQRALSTATKN